MGVFSTLQCNPTKALSHLCLIIEEDFIKLSTLMRSNVDEDDYGRLTETYVGHLGSLGFLGYLHQIKD